MTTEQMLLAAVAALAGSTTFLFQLLMRTMKRLEREIDVCNRERLQAELRLATIEGRLDRFQPDFK